MKTLTTIAVLLALHLPLATAEDLPSAESVFDGYFDATGGKAKMQAVRTQVQHGTLSLPDLGMDAQYTSYQSPPNALTVSEFEGMGIVKNGLTDGYAWSLNPFQGNSINKADDPAAGLMFPLVYWEMGGTAKVTGESETDGAPAYVLVYSPTDGDPITMYFAKDTGLLLRTEQENSSGGTAVTKFSDFKKIGGLTLAHTIEQTGGALNLMLTFDSIEIDVDIPAEKLAMPEEIKALKE